VHHVFVSYSRSDGGWVHGLARRLEQQHLDVWVDQRDIPVTVPWLTEVRDAIEEAALFLRCDSPAFGVSASCGAEVGFAEQAAKPQFAVQVGTDLDGCAASIRRTLAEISPVRARRTELRVLARDWDRAGRPRNLLVARGHRRRLASGLALSPPSTEAEEGFLRASTIRTRVRALITAVVVTLTATSLLSIGALRAAQDLINHDNSQLANASGQVQSGLGLIAQDPYSGLQLAAADGGDENAWHADVVTQALAEPTPDDAFVIPGARWFAATPVGAEVFLTDAAGREWRHPSAASQALQQATTVPAAGVPAPATAAAPTGGEAAGSGTGGLTASGNPHSGMVQVFRQGRLWRTIDFDVVAGALAFSPDGRFLAATGGRQVEVADLASAQVRIQLRGATGPLLDVAWSADGTHVWALDDDRVFSWLTGSAVTLIDNPAATFNSVLPAASHDDTWIVGAHALTEISVATGKPLRSITLPDTLLSAGAAPDGSLALVSGQRHLWVVPLSGTAGPRHITLKGCSLGRPTFATDAVAYEPCIGASLLRLSLPAAAVTTVITVSPGGVFAATADPSTGTVYAGDEAGYLYVVRGSHAVPIEASHCDPEVEHIGVAPGGRSVLPVGNGSGQGTCTAIGLRSAGDPGNPGSWTWNHLLEPQEQSVYASAVAFSPHGGSFAIGYSNGVITIHPTVNVTPTLVENTTDGMVRDMLTLPDSDLIIVTSTGMVQRLTLCDSCVSDANLARVANDRLQLAKRLGLITLKRVPAGSDTPPSGPTRR
jgi:hypothetical protein